MARIVAREGGVGSGSGRGMEARPVKKRGQRGSCSSRLFHEREIILHNAVAALYAEGNWPAPPDKLVALAHAGLKVWAKVGNLQFPPE